jgi:hypothetical protein
MGLGRRRKCYRSLAERHRYQPTVLPHKKHSEPKAARIWQHIPDGAAVVVEYVAGWLPPLFPDPQTSEINSAQLILPSMEPLPAVIFRIRLSGTPIRDLKWIRSSGAHAP